MYHTIYKEVEIDIDLSDFDTGDLIEELESRGHPAADVSDGNSLVCSIYEKRRLGKDYQSELDQLIYQVTGRAL
jgi:hypothetical protein